MYESEQYWNNNNNNDNEEEEFASEFSKFISRQDDSRFRTSRDYLARVSSGNSDGMRNSA